MDFTFHVYNSHLKVLISVDGCDYIRFVDRFISCKSSRSRESSEGSVKYEE